MGSIRIKSGRNSKKPKKSWDRGYGRRNAYFTAFKGLFVGTHSELLITIITITILWILLTRIV